MLASLRTCSHGLIQPFIRQEMTKETASPVCYAADADDAYMGYAPRDEIIAALNILLEAERAGAKVALASAKLGASAKRAAGVGAGDDSDGGGLAGYAPLMLAVRDDEARWCAMLSGHIRRLGGEPSPKTGDFHGKALAIADPLERLAFLNRGQAWVVRKLEELMRRVRDDALHADLRAMLGSHRDNIGQADAFIVAAGGIGDRKAVDVAEARKERR